MVWLIVIALGALLNFCAMRMVAAANQNSRLPMIFGRASHSPRRPAVFYLMLAASLGLLMWGAIWGFQEVGAWASAAVVAFMMPSLILTVRHNRGGALRSQAKREAPLD
ncbi:hypothetical protein ACJ65_06690 [Kocuria rhizophila]|uniref:hypothetical protein n=1 Tax=Kocuria rhizophila TaxID=72000 RepID=UPI00057E0601|nr:hypothetical protein [Kocuria rhizophila]KIC68628.1 hypothetical protein RK09_06260 [Kocuria rhizophila]KMK73294.1 hypothetical protein ACJ65_06690 [Kocuria rhizophila]